MLRKLLRRQKIPNIINQITPKSDAITYDLNHLNHKLLDPSTPPQWILRSPISSPLGNLSAGVNIIVPDDVVLAKVAAGLHLNKRHWQFPRVLHTVHCAEGDVD